MSRRDPLELARAMSGYDEAFEARHVDEITEAVAHASMVTDGDGHQVLVLRLGEIASALTHVHGQHFLALVACRRALAEGDPRSRRRIPPQAAGASVVRSSASPLFSDFKARCFRDDDRETRGRCMNPSNPIAISSRFSSTQFCGIAGRKASSHCVASSKMMTKRRHIANPHLA